MRVVLDTNVWLSGLLWGGLPDQILQQVESGTLQAIASEAILDELTKTLDRPKLQRRLNQLEIETVAIMQVVRQVVVMVPNISISVDGWTVRSSSSILTMLDLLLNATARGFWYEEGNGGGDFRQK